jgi:hypothetical protein
MRGFARRHTVEAALDVIDALVDAQLHSLDAESLPLQQAAGRVLADDVASGVDVPGFDRATMDGYAVVADSTEGATAYNPIPLMCSATRSPDVRFGARSVRPGSADHDGRSASGWLQRRCRPSGSTIRVRCHASATTVSPRKACRPSGEDVFGNDGAASRPDAAAAGLGL